MQAYTRGKLKIEGDIMKSQLIEKLFKFGNKRGHGLPVQGLRFKRAIIRTFNLRLSTDVF